MTREFAQKYADVINAFMNGKDIQWKNDDGKWIDTEDPLWCDCREYRIKPTSNYRPYANAEEFLKASKEHGPYLRNSSVYYDIPLRVLSQGVYLIDYSSIFGKSNGTLEANFYNYFTLYKEFHWQGGTPCGILENE